MAKVQVYTFENGDTGLEMREMQKYTVKIYENDQERYESTIQSENIHDDLWDIISDAIWAAYPTQGQYERASRRDNPESLR